MKIIAEIGSNWRTLDEALNCIHLAKACGADAVKFQLYDFKSMYGYQPPIVYDPEKMPPNTVICDIEMEGRLPVQWLPKLKAKADTVGIEFMCSAFSPELIAQVDPYVKTHKIASCEMAHIRMLQAVKETGKPLILSTGGYGLADIEGVVRFLGNHPTTLMHCNVSYPTNYVDLNKMTALIRLGLPVGYSDHTTSIDAVPALMKSYGVSVYEKHFNPLELEDTPDAPHSLGIDAFKTMVKVLRGEPVAYTEENQARLQHVRRVIAIKPIGPGDTLIEGDNIGIYRALKPDAHGANPFMIDKIAGRRSKHAIECGNGVYVTDVV